MRDFGISFNEFMSGKAIMTWTRFATSVGSDLCFLLSLYSLFKNKKGGPHQYLVD
jgi:hypothetical protein